MFKNIVILICGSISFTIGLIALIGYLFDSAFLYRWNNVGIGMARETAISVTLVGFGLLLVAIDRLSTCFCRRHLKSQQNS